MRLCLFEPCRYGRILHLSMTELMLCFTLIFVFFSCLCPVFFRVTICVSAGTVLIFLQLLLIGLQLDGFASDWAAALVPFYFPLLVASFVTIFFLGYLVMVLCFICCECRNHECHMYDCRDYSLNLLGFLLFSSFVISFYLFIVKLKDPSYSFSWLFILIPFTLASAALLLAAIGWAGWVVFDSYRRDGCDFCTCCCCVCPCSPSPIRLPNVDYGDAV